MFRLVALALCSFVLGGCIPTSAVRMPEGMEKEVRGPSGLIFGSIGAGTQVFSSQSLLFRKKGSADSGRLIFIHDGLMTVPLDLDEKSLKATIFAVRLPVGEYELHQVSFFINRAQFGTTTFEENFSVPFQVEEGRSTYLGEFAAFPIMAKNFFGMGIPAGGYFVVSDKFDRDLALLSKKPESVPAWPAKDATIDVKSLNLPMLRVSTQ